MKVEDIPKYRAMSEEQLKKEIPNWEWFKSLKVGDQAAIFSDSCLVIGLENGYMPVIVKAVNKDGSVEIYNWPHKFYYCRQPNDMDATIGLIPRVESTKVETIKIDWLGIVSEVIRLRNENHGRGEIKSIMRENEDKYVIKT